MTTIAPYTAAQYRDAVRKYLDDRAAMLYQQEQAKKNGERQRAGRYQLGIDAMQAAADRHQELADIAAEREATNGK